MVTRLSVLNSTHGSLNVRAGFVSGPGGSDAPHGLEPGARMDFRLRQHGGLLAEALDDRAHERADARGGDQHGVLALAGGVLEAVAHQADELGEARGLHRELPVLALADDRFDEGLLPA